MKERHHTIGIDLGGTKVAGVLIDRNGHIVARERTSSLPERGADSVAETVALMVRALAAAAPSAVGGVGIGVAGQVDSTTGTVSNAPNLRWHNFPLGQVIRETTGHRVAVLNDVQAATFGEWSYGAARGATEAVCMFIGTGVGGGIISNGQLFRGKSGAAGELGHTVVSLHGPGCRCGGRGCLEAYAGGWAIARRGFDVVSARPLAGRALVEAAGGDATAITATALANAAMGGDPLARTLVREIEDALVAGLGSITNALNPEMIILGGGVIEALPQLLEESRQRLALQALPVSAAAVRVERASLGGDAGAIGAAAWARTSH